MIGCRGILIRTYFFFVLFGFVFNRGRVEMCNLSSVGIFRALCGKRRKARVSNTRGSRGCDLRSEPSSPVTFSRFWFMDRRLSPPAFLSEWTRQHYSPECVPRRQNVRGEYPAAAGLRNNRRCGAAKKQSARRVSPDINGRVSLFSSHPVVIISIVDSSVVDDPWPEGESSRSGGWRRLNDIPAKIY